MGAQACGQAGVLVLRHSLCLMPRTNAIEVTTHPLFFSLLLCATRARTQARRQPDRWIVRCPGIRADGCAGTEAWRE